MKYDLQLCVGSRLRRLSRIADAYFRSQLAEYNITENQMTILFALREMGEVKQGEIGQNLALERSTVSRNIKLLEKQDYITRTSNYRPKISLSTEGLELVKTLIPLWEETMDTLIAKIGAKGMASISQLEKNLT